MAELQTIPARHGVATFVPAGQTIKIINTSGTQVVDTWAFALPAPEAKKSSQEKEKPDEPKEESKNDSKDAPAKLTPQKKKAGKKNDLPSQEDAEAATKKMLDKKDEEATDKANGGTPQKSTWSSYVPSVSRLGLGGKKDGQQQQGEKAEGETEQQKNSRTWASYFPSGKGFSSYIPKQATDTVSSFGAMHSRDMSKSYLEQLQDFSKTPVGAAGMKAVTGSGYSGSLLAGYQAWNAANAKDVPAMEFMSMMHSRAATLHLVPRVNDVLVTNLREPIMTLVEDSSPGVHDTLIAACDPQRYKGLGVDKWEQHGSCAENLVLALKELNERAGLKGAKGVGADVTINNVPAPLNLFMNIPWDNEGDIGFNAPKSSKGDFVRLKAERDIVVVMSACPQDVLDINAKQPTDANFIVEGGEDQTSAIKRTAAPTPKKKPIPKKRAPAAAKAGAENNADDAKSTVSSASAARKKPIPPSVQPSKKTQPTQPLTKNAPPTKKPPPAKKPAAAANAAPPAANGDALAVEKKKPRKLPPRQKPAPAAGES